MVEEKINEENFEENFVKEIVNDWVNITFAGKSYNSAFWIIEKVKECLELRQKNSKTEFIEKISNS